MRRDDALLLDMLLACQKLVRFTDSITIDAFLANELVQSAVIREFQVLGDAARLVTEPTRAVHPAIPWRVIAGMRNRLVHAYFDIRLEAVWDTIQHDIPPLLTALEAIRSAPDGSEADHDNT